MSDEQDWSVDHLTAIAGGGLDEPRLRSLLVDRLGSGYWPPSDGMTFKLHNRRRRPCCKDG